MCSHLQTRPGRDGHPETLARTTIRVLLLDANHAEAADLRAKLADSRQVGFSVRTASTLNEALQLLERHRFDVILVDLNSTSRPGVPLLMELLTLAPETPMIAVTANHQESEALEFVRAGAQDYLVKSRLNSAAIERILIYCIERQRAIRRGAAQYGISRVLSESTTLEEVRLNLLRVLCETCGCERSHFWQFDHWSSDLALVQTWTRPGANDGDFERSRLAQGEGLAGIAWTRGIPQSFDDLSARLDIPQCAAATSAGFHSALAFPVKLEGETLAVIELFSRDIVDTDGEFLNLLTNVGGQLGQFMARKSAEEEREHLTRERLLILDCASEGIYGVDLNGCVTFMNRSAAAMLQCSWDEVLGRNSHELFCRRPREKSSHSAENCPIARTIAQQQGIRREINHLRRANGADFEAEFSVFPLVETGQIKGAVACFNDMTDRKRLEVELRHAQKLEAVGALAAGIAHEINTPIQFVGDNTRFLQDAFRDVSDLVGAYERFQAIAQNGTAAQAALDEIIAAHKKADWDYLKSEIPKALEQALDGVGRVATIVRGMKEFSHVDRSSEKTPADLNKALESTLIVARNELKYVADVEVNYGDIPPILCHLGDLNQVFLNLLINASHAIGDVVKGTQKKGRIDVATRRDGDWIDVSFSDSGTGIPETVRDKIFDPFFTTKEVGKGTGQGLALARAVVVEKHGGTLTFETAMGKGTTFRVRLPLNTKSEAHEVGAR